MSRFRIEDCVKSVEAYLKANLNTYIGAMNTERPTGSQLENIPTNAYVFMSLDERVKNFKTFVFIDLQTPIFTGNQSSFGETHTVDILIFMPDKNISDNSIRQLRMWEALKDCLREGWSKIIPGRKFDMQSIDPFSVDIFNNSFVHKVFGVSLSITIAT